MIDLFSAVDGKASDIKACISQLGGPISLDSYYAETMRH